MSRVSVAERTKLSVFLARGLLRRFVGRVLAHPLVQWPFSFGKADRLLIAPQDLRTADATRASEIYAGRFAFAGKVVICDARSPFEMAPPSEEWAASLLGFGWLRHLRAAESGITRANARALVDEWISLQLARPDRLAPRGGGAAHHLLAQPGAAGAGRIGRCGSIAASCAASPARSATCATRRRRRATACRAFKALIALTYAALCMAGQQRHIRGATKRLGDELERQILPDGGHISRNPGALIEILVDLLPLRNAFTARNIAPPPALLNAIDRMMPMLRFFRHGDGNFALFNGMGPTPAIPAHHHPGLRRRARRAARERAAFRLPAPRERRHRGGDGHRRAAADAGEPGGACRLPVVRALQQAASHRGQLRPAGHQPRKLAAGRARHRRAFDRHVQRHVVVPFHRIGCVPAHADGTPMVGGPHDIQSTREEQGGAIMLRTSHDGYADVFNVIHQRALMLSRRRAAGSTARTCSCLPRAKWCRRGRDEFAVRFHLHPTVKANRLSDGHSAMLMLPNREVWNFNAYEDRVEIEESVYLAGPTGRAARCRS